MKFPKLGVRSRFLVWLIAIGVPGVIAAWMAMSVIETRLAEEIEANLVNARRLEAARIVDALSAYEKQATQLTAGKHVRSFVGMLADYYRGVLPADTVIGGVDQFKQIDPLGPVPLAQLARRLKGKAITTGSDVRDLRLVGLDGRILGQSAGFSWDQPYDTEVVTRTLETGKPQFGNAFRVSQGDDRLGLVAPIFSVDSEIVGALILEMALDPIVGLVLEHEAYGETTESHIAQLTPDGDAQFITLLRFNRQAAFDLVVPRDRNLPINQSLQATGGKVIRAADYRNQLSVLAIETVPKTGWGLVVKKDLSEAVAPIVEIQWVLLSAAVIACLALFGGWFLFLRPLGKRIDNAAIAADRIASGDYSSLISDRTGDEIGEMSRSIDRLANDLSAGNRLRVNAEKKLEYQATHDDLTQVFNRKKANDFIRKFLSPEANNISSILFLDLNGFKSINDGHGHAVGDEILKVTAARLCRAMPDGLVARWGGDEFVAILPSVDRTGAEQTADFVRDLISVPIAVNRGSFKVSASIGVGSSAPELRAIDVVNKADVKMLAMKQMRDPRAGILETTRLVETAIRDHQVQIWFQAIVAPTDQGQKIYGAEALVRLRDPSGRLVEPGEFLPQISHAPVMRALEERVCELALNTLGLWRKLKIFDQHFRLAINLSAQATNSKDFIEIFESIRQRADVPADNIILEISEESRACNRQILQRYADNGVALAADDVGIEGSNLDRLAWDGVTIAKIDKSWIADPRESSAARKTVVLKQLVEICGKLGIATIAEGVETVAQQQYLDSLGMRWMQGYHFDRPCPAREFADRWAKTPVLNR